MEGVVEGMPILDKRIDPSTNEIIPGSTLVHEVKSVYTIPFSKQKVNELSKYFADNTGFIVKDKHSTTRYSCSMQEFLNLEYEELLNLKTGFTDYMKSQKRSGSTSSSNNRIPTDWFNLEKEKA